MPCGSEAELEKAPKTDGHRWSTPSSPVPLKIGSPPVAICDDLSDRHPIKLIKTTIYQEKWAANRHPLNNTFWTSA
jgi:hypothetical protein